MHARLSTAATLVFRLTLFGYLALLAIGVARGARPADLIRVIVDQDILGGELKDLFAPVAGVTSFTQLGIAYVVIGGVLLLADPTRLHARRLIIVLLLGLMRAFFLTERLAILELLVPLMTIAAMWAVARAKAGRKLLINLAPLIIVPLVALVFSLFEYSRSWVWYRENGATSFLSFAVDRFGGYYATAYNNGQILYNYQRVPGRIPYRSIEGLWSAPGIEQLGLYDRLETASYPSSSDLLKLHGNPEFNNPCGLCDPFVDWGPTGGWIFLACVAILLSSAYVMCTLGRPVGLMVYPPMVTGVYELPRYIYWTAGRVIPAIVALAAVGIWLGRPQKHHPGPEPGSTEGLGLPAPLP
jgi:hypothetical protein